MFHRLIKINNTIQRGWDKVSWIVYTCTGSSLMGVLISTAIPQAAMPVTAVLIMFSAAVYYCIGKTHDKHH